MYILRRMCMQGQAVYFCCSIKSFVKVINFSVLLFRYLPFLPYESDFLCDCRRDRDPLDSVHIFEERGVEDSSAQIFLDKSLNGVKLAGI